MLFIYFMNCIKPPSQLRHELRQFFERNGLSSSLRIAKTTGINQSQVYRNLFGHPKRVTKETLRELCNYANISIYTERADPRDSSILMEALGLIWDGSEIHARRLAELLFAHRKACL